MRKGRPMKEIVLSDRERNVLIQLVASAPKARLKKRVRAILMAEEGHTNVAISSKIGLSEQAISKWRKQYLADGVDGLYDQCRSGRKNMDFSVPDEDRSLLMNWSQSLSLPQSLVIRAKIVLLSAEGKTSRDVSSAIGVCAATVRKWKRKFRENGMEGLYDEYRKGRPRTHSDDEIALLLQRTLESRPKGATHWSCRSMAEETDISASTVNRVWNLFSIKPHKRKGFKLSTDPFFVDKVIDVCGLYLNPPDNALVLCVDEKSQCQALERTQPILPMGIGYAEGATDNYFRHGVTTLFSALNVATGEVQIACKKRHRNQEFIAFLNQIKRNVPEDLDIHLIVDNYSTHKHENVKAWRTRNPRFHFHFTPTYSSWLNQVERWFGIITDKAIRRGSFTSVKDLVKQIETFTEAYNRKAKPFVWTATPEEILEKVGRLCRKINGNYE
jgi:putative transposase